MTPLIAEIHDRLERAGLGELVAAVRAQLHDEVWITATPTDAPVVGASRIGGAPDLPRGTEWPRWRIPRTEVDGWPDWARDEAREAIAAGIVIDEGDRVALALPFVAQLDLTEVAPLQNRLPRRGRLWLFADQTTHAGVVGDYPVIASACLWDPGDAVLERVTPPPVPDSLAPRALAFAAGTSLPEASDLGLRGDVFYRYTEAVAPLRQQLPRHAVLSGPEFGSADVPPTGYTTLLRVDSDDTMNWGDAAWVTFAIPDTALDALAFDAVRAFRWVG